MHGESPRIFYHIGHNLKGEKGNPDRKRDLGDGQCCTCHPVQGIYAEIQIFENIQGKYPSLWGHWVGILAYTLQIYFDFSGYSDMAIGMGKMFGFDFLENLITNKE